MTQNETQDTDSAAFLNGLRTFLMAVIEQQVTEVLNSNMMDALVRQAVESRIERITDDLVQEAAGNIDPSDIESAVEEAFREEIERYDASGDVERKIEDEINDFDFASAIESALSDAVSEADIEDDVQEKIESVIEMMLEDNDSIEEKVADAISDEVASIDLEDSGIETAVNEKIDEALVDLDSRVQDEIDEIDVAEKVRDAVRAALNTLAVEV